MANQQKHKSKPVQTWTPERAMRLYRLLGLLRQSPQTRSGLMKRLRLDVSGFYRDLEVLREAGFEIVLEGRKYILQKSDAGALERLPFPDPHLTLGEAQRLAKGRTKVHRKLKELIAALLP